ncbi:MULTISPECIES: DUF1850 domain-containing protein [unclassified Lysinibacillus]|uniref:DUF1850 domain-containing protein n=1 Tax=unclassified Lysinibacillus TaxID=2636778 RepID=UPI002012F324|nr:DUF1850 domain-containing protein [Lysinibacillus sp. BPa_S21]MCL1697964.1 DUF1850 domain-containing protein [Lysinibacillus sp. BPa_S21]MCL1702936.1 DUF1850 domain-containing protein [Lysinibacillus sp. Bpr_S20]
MRKRTLIIVLAFLCICISVVIFLPLQKVFAFTETRINDPAVHYIPLTTEDTFEIRYTHSIHKTDVLEHYKCVDGTSIQMLGMEYESLAIGMPSYAEKNQTLTERNGKYFLQFDNEIIGNFTIYIGDLDLDLVLDYENYEYDLKKDLQRGKSYLFEVKRLSLYEQWKGVRMK